MRSLRLRLANIQAAEKEGCFEQGHLPIMLCVGIPTASSCRMAERVNTTIADALYEYPRSISGEKTCRRK